MVIENCINIKLKTSVDLVTVPLKVIREYLDNSQPLEDRDPIYVQLVLCYGNHEYSGRGEDFLGSDALADLQKSLPANIKIECCMTCCCGNMCPYGNAPGTLFCSKGYTINSKEDLLKYFDGDRPALPEVNSNSFCKEFIYQSSGYYTYNDFKYYLQ